MGSASGVGSGGRARRTSTAGRAGQARAPGPLRAPVVDSGAGLLTLQRLAGNAAVSRLVAQAKDDGRLAETVAFHLAQEKAEKAKAETLRGQIVQDVARFVAEGDGVRLLPSLRSGKSEIDDLTARYRAVHGRELRADLLKHFSHTKDLVRALALLYSGDDTDPYAQMGLALIPLGTRDSDVLRLLEERPQSARQVLEREYREAFQGIEPGDGQLATHLAADLSDWRRQKAHALLDHDLTPAEHLHFHTTAIAGAHEPAALAILQAEWDKGPQAFLQLVKDWRQYVKGNGWTDMELKTAMTDELSGEDLAEATAIFQSYESWLGGKDEGPGLAKVVAARNQLRLLLGATVFVDHQQVIKATARLRKAWEEVIAKDPARSVEWEKERAALEQHVSTTLFSLRSWNRGDAVEGAINLHREPTLADKAWLAYERHDDKGVLAAVTAGWLGGTDAQAQMMADAREGSPPRPAFDLRADVIRSGSDEARKMGALLNYNRDHVERGATRLAMDFQGTPGSTAAADLQDAYEFLRSIKDENLRINVVGTLVTNAKNIEGQTWQERFTDFVEKHYEKSPLRVDMLALVLGEKTPEGLLERAEQRAEATHTGWLDSAGMALTEAYDVVTAEDTIEVADERLRRFRQFVHRTKADDVEVRAMLEREGASDVAALAKMSYEQFKARLDEVRAVKAATTEVVGMIVDFAGRSALVALFGPAGLAGLGAALGAYAGGMLVREGLLGSEYQLASKENLSTLAGEVATFGFDELRIEKVIGDVLALDPAKQAKKAVAIASRDEKIMKGVQDGIKQAGTKFFEKSVQNAIEGKDFPSLEQIVNRALQAMAVGGVKGSTGHYSKRATVFTPRLERFRTNVISIMLNGPPPKAALALALTKELTDLVASGAWHSMSGPEVAARMASVALQSAVSAIPVAAALGVHAERAALRGRDLLKANPEILRGMAWADPKVRSGYDLYKITMGKVGVVEALTFDEWWRLRAKDRATIRTIDTDRNEVVILDLKKWYSDQAQALDTVITEADWKQKVGGGRG